MTNQEIFDRIRVFLTETLGIENGVVKSDALLTDVLGGDPFDKFALITDIENMFGINITDDEEKHILGVNDLVKIVGNKVKQKEQTQNNTSTKVRFGAYGKYLICGSLPTHEVGLYLQKLQNFKAESGVNCAAKYVFRLDGVSGSGPVLTIGPVDRANAYGLNPVCTCRKMGKGCFRRIKQGDGACKDPFVTEIIGKVFFPDQYKKRR